MINATATASVTTATPNATPILERIRVKCGLPRPTFLRLIGALPGRTAMLHFHTHRIDPVFLERAAQLEALYDRWKTQVIWDVDAAGPAGLSIRDFAHLLNLSEFTFWRDTRLGLIPTDQQQAAGRTMHRMTGASVRKLFEHCESLLASSYVNGRPQRTPLTAAFVRALPDDLQTSAA